jgi:O-antigen ligase
VLLLLVWWRRRFKPTLGPVIVWMLAYGAAIGLSVVMADRRGIPLERLMLYGRDLLLVFVITNLITSWSGLRVATWAMIAAGCTLSILAFANLATGATFGGLAHVWTNVLVGGGRLGVRIAGPDWEPNIFAQQLVIVIPLALYAVWTEHRLVLRLLALAAVAVLGWTFFLTYSRGGLLGLLGALACIALLRPAARARWVFGVIAVLALLIVAVPAGYWQRLETTATYVAGASDGDPSLRGRSAYWRVAALMAIEHPLAGVGLGNYEPLWSSFRLRVDPDLPVEAQGVQMILVHVAAETGVVGVITLVGVVAAAIVSLRRARKRAAREGQASVRDLAAALEAAMYGYVVASLFLDGGGERDFWLLVALAAAAGRLTAAGDGWVETSQPQPAASDGDLVPTFDRRWRTSS